MTNKFRIFKASGEEVVFNPHKLRSSLEKAGAGKALVDSVVSRIVSELHDGMTTREIYRKAFSYLKSSERPSAARYSLKKAILALGPAGYPFEQFIARLFANGFDQMETGSILKGACVTHEVDIYAWNRKIVLLGECKYHAGQERKSDVKTALYFHSRFNDLQAGLAAAHRDKNFRGLLVTNTRFTEDAETYGRCSGLELLSWDLPKNSSLKDIIGRSGLHPVTCMTTITRKEKELLISKGILLTRDLAENPEALKVLNAGETRKAKILREAAELCNPL